MGHLAEGYIQLNGAAATFLGLIGIALLVLPRRYAPLALLTGVCYIPAYVGIQMGSFNFTAIRLLIAVGVVRMLVRREVPHDLATGIDRAMLAWISWLLLSSIFHEDSPAAFVFRLGLAYDALGIYVLARSYCRSVDDVSGVCRAIALVLVPLGLAMLYEKSLAYNLFSILGGVGEHPLVREGNVRANGPFGHPILAGTVGGICLPIMVGLWKSNRTRSRLGILACVSIIFSSASSGPILSAVAGLFAVYLWRHRERMRIIRWAAVWAYVLLDVIMRDPAYFIIARIDLAGGSTSWYRARLIQSAFEHLSEWWLAGTDTTRHWMWVVVSWSAKHTDITSHYIQLGVWGGIPLLLLFILLLWRGFAGVACVVREEAPTRPHAAFQVWTLGAMLFAIAITGLSVSYFDQSFVFIFLALGIIGSAAASMASAGAKAASSATRVAVPAGSALSSETSTQACGEAQGAR